MRRFLRTLYSFTVLFGLDPRKTVAALRGLPFYLRDFNMFRRLKNASDIHFPFGRPLPCLEDRFSTEGRARGHYFHQDLLVARRVFENAPDLHVDAGSRVDGFVAHVASFRPLEVLDIIPLGGDIPNVSFVQCDLTADLPASLVEYCDSLSCLHALEHFGLGRYGDKVRFDGHLVGFNNLRRILRPHGKLYLSVPIGEQRVEFNGHRIFSLEYLLELIGSGFRIDSFSYVDDRGDLFEDVVLTDRAVETDCGCRYGCGIFEMTKIDEAAAGAPSLTNSRCAGNDKRPDNDAR
jgi:SAM-dependent methyltransferase